MLTDEASSLAITTDIWTSSTNDSYIPLTIHFVTKEWETRNCILETRSFPEHHTGANIADKLKNMMSVFDIENSKVVAVVHDQGSNIQLCGEILENDVGWYSISCAAHKLQLCVNGALNSQQSIARAIGAARKLVGHFRHSALATAALKKRQVQMNLPEKKLKQDISTRWNSTFYMIQRLLEARWPVVAVLSDESVTKRSDRFLDLRSEQWDLLQELSKVLEPIEIATVFLSYESNVSISCIYPIVFGLLDNLQVSEDDSPSCSLFKNEVSSSIRSRWCLDSIDPLAVSTLATCLDPRFRNLKFLSDTLKTSVKEELKERVQQMQHDPEIDQDSQALQDQPPPSKKTALDQLLGVEEEELESCMEVDTYLSGKPISRSTNPLEWWKENKTRFPCLAQLARTVLCIPATSTPSERLFSKAGLTISKLRSNLKPDNVNALLFLHQNKKCLF